jgi:hypothetical protein
MTILEIITLANAMFKLICNFEALINKQKRKKL